MSAPDPPPTERVPGPAAGRRPELVAGLRCGLMFGLVDGAIAAWRVEDPIGVMGGLGCIAASVLLYLGLFLALVLLLGIGLRLLRRGRAPSVEALVVGGIGVGVFFEVYWWSREYVFWGHSAVSPERLGAAAVMLVVSFAVALGAVRAGRAVPRLASRVAPPVALVLAAAGALFLAGERALVGDRSLGAIDEANRDLPNVLFVIVDALRDDVLGAYGSERVETPVMDQLARDGVLFENALVQAPFTWSSFGSFLTGKYPRRHGMLKLRAGHSWVRHINKTLPLHLKTAERPGREALREEDYVSAAFMTGAVTRGSGLLAGVDLYCEALLGHELVHRASRWSRFSSDLLVFNVWNKLTQRIDYNKAGSTATSWLVDNAADRRFFAMLHLYSTHTPYAPADEFRHQYVDPDYTGPITEFTAEHRYAIDAGDYEPTPEDVEQIRNLYYAGTAQADHAIGLVVEELERQGVLDDTLVIVTSDHGEELGEHGLWEHNWMYQTNLRIPLILRWPAGLPRGKRVSALVESIDLFPTLCSLLGLALPEIPEGEDGPYHRVDGVDLMPLVRGEVDSVKELSFAESGPTLAVQDRSWKLVVSKDCLEYEPDDPGWERAVRTPQLFDLVADPGEMENLFGRNDEQVVRLLHALRAWDATLPIPREAVQESHRDREAEALLEGLGYTGDTGDDSELRSGN